MKHIWGHIEVGTVNDSRSMLKETHCVSALTLMPKQAAPNPRQKKLPQPSLQSTQHSLLASLLTCHALPSHHRAFTLAFCSLLLKCPFLSSSPI